VNSRASRRLKRKRGGKNEGREEDCNPTEYSSPSYITPRPRIKSALGGGRSRKKAVRHDRNRREGKRMEGSGRGRGERPGNEASRASVAERRLEALCQNHAVHRRLRVRKRRRGEEKKAFGPDSSALL